MLTVWLIRTFTHDLVEHVARVRGETAPFGSIRRSSATSGLAIRPDWGWRRFWCTTLADP